MVGRAFLFICRRIKDATDLMASSLGKNQAGVE